MERPPRAARILVLDDDPRMVDLLCEVLRLRGHDVRGARRFAEAEALLAEAPADLLVTDLRMPDVDGASAFRTLRERGLVPRAIVVSGFVEARASEELGACEGVVGIVAKPFDLEELARRVDEALTR
jgi:DNA-binding response OmpR family regulator